MPEVDWHLWAGGLNLSAWVGRHNRSRPPAAPSDLLVTERSRMASWPVLSRQHQHYDPCHFMVLPELLRPKRSPDFSPACRRRCRQPRSHIVGGMARGSPAQMSSLAISKDHDQVAVEVSS